MTKRSIVVGLLLAALLSGVTFFNDEVMKGTNLIGHFLPPSVFGAVLLVALFLNPLMARIWPRAVLSGRELAAVMGILLFVCYMPGRGLMHYFTTFLMLPHHHERTTPGWRGEPERLEAGQLLDAARLAADLRAGAAARAGSVPGLIWERMPDELRVRLRDGTVRPEAEADRAALLAALNAAVDDPGFAAAVRGLPDGLPPHALVRLRQSPDSRSPAEACRLNRALIDTSFPRAVAARRAGVLESVPRQWLADPRRDSTRVLDGFVTGLSQGDERIAFSAVPWFAWWRTMLFWIPLILTLCVMCTGLALVVHRQWSANEHLPYPTVEFACAVLPQEGETSSPMLRSRLFWFGALTVLAIHLSNYAAVWWPDYIIPVRTRLDLTPLADIFTTFKKGNWWGLFSPTLCFTAIGFAFFLASDVSLSLGIAPYVYVLATAIAAGYGVAVDGGHLRPATETLLYGGGYVGMFLVLAYTGRHHYRTVFTRALGLGRNREVDGDALRGARVFYVAMAAFLVQLTVAGIEFPLALVYTLGMLLIFIVASRLLTEAGVFFLHPYTYPCAMLWGFMGAGAVGQGQLLLLGMLSSLLLIDPREAFMPFAVSATGLASRQGNSPTRAARWGLIALALGFAVAVPAALYWQYQMGAIRAGDGWTVGNVPRFAFDLNTEIGRTLEAQDNLLASQQLHGWARFAHMHAQPKLVVAFLITFSLTLLFSFCRHRFARWPLHPLIFLVLGTWQSRTLGFSFLLGWAIKAAVMKYGGVPAFRRLKPVMIGLVAGDVLAAVVTLIVGAVYYRVTGNPPKPFSVFPG